MAGTAGSSAVLHGDPSGCGGVPNELVIPLVLIRVALGEVRDRLVERGALAEVGADRHTVPRAGVRPGERPPAGVGIARETLGVDRLQVRRGLAVPELANVEVPRDAVGREEPAPAEEDVARGLHQPLAVHDAPAVLRGAAPAGERLEDRTLRLLRLEDERIVRIPAEEEDAPGARPDAPDADDLAGDVDEPVGAVEVAAVEGQALIAIDHAMEMVLDL